MINKSQIKNKGNKKYETRREDIIYLFFNINYKKLITFTYK